MLESVFTDFIHQKAMSQTTNSMGETVNLDSYSTDYVIARQRFKAAAVQLGFNLHAYPITETGPGGEALSIDVAIFNGRPATDHHAPALVLSSGIHGVEGYFGSALQLSLLQHWIAHPEQLPTVRIVLIHAMNPYGFAWRRRANEHNVDLNRNLILPDEAYHGSHPLYRALDPLLNPKCPPSGRDGFPAHLAPLGLQHGISALTDAITHGQYDFPYGLYYGGDRPSPLSLLLASQLGSWLGNAQHVIHLDVHTGLGAWANYKLLFDHPMSDALYARMRQYFGKDALEPREAMNDSVWSGGLGHYCQTLAAERDYVCAVAEFGTYPGIQVLAGMRAENQSYFWLQGSDVKAEIKREKTKQRLVELFCPTSPSWRKQTLTQGLRLIAQALAGLQTQAAAL